MKGEEIDKIVAKLNKQLTKLSDASDETKAKVMSYAFAAICSRGENKFAMNDVVMVMLQTMAVTQGYIVKECRANPSNKSDASDYVMMMAGAAAMAELMDATMPASVRELMGDKIEQSRELIGAALEAQRVLQRAKGGSAS